MKTEDRSGHGQLHNWAPDRVCWWKGSLIRRIIIWCACHLQIFSSSYLQSNCFFYLEHFKETSSCLRNQDRYPSIHLSSLWNLTTPQNRDEICSSTLILEFLAARGTRSTTVHSFQVWNVHMQFNVKWLQNNHTSLNLSKKIATLHWKETWYWPFCIEYENNLMSHYIEEVHGIEWCT